MVVLLVGRNGHVCGTGRRWGGSCNVATAAKRTQQSCQSETEHRRCERKDDEEPGPLHESILTGRSTRRDAPVRRERAWFNRGHLTVYPNTLPSPLVSDLNEMPGDVRANMVVATLSSSGTITIYNYTGSMDVVVDVLGWYS